MREGKSTKMTFIEVDNRVKSIMIFLNYQLFKLFSLLAIFISHIPHLAIGVIGKDNSTEDRGIIADLHTQTVLRPIFNYQENISIMALGDSITSGEHRVNAFPGAYRIQLWDHFQNNQLTINWVGRLQNESLTHNHNFDSDHEGHGGWKISQIKNLVKNNLFTYQRANLVLLMIGTNDFLGSAKAEDALRDLEVLLNTIKYKAPKVKVFVSDIPPINPQGSKDSANVNTAQQVKDFNAGIASVVSRVASPHIIPIAVGSQLDLNEINPDGVHPTQAGYDKMGNIWYHSLMRPDSLNNIQNLRGSQFNDKLMGSKTSNILDGQGGDDELRGTPAVLAGASEQDILSGGTGADRFILGDTVQPYYTAVGDQDYARLVDFDASEDIVQLHGVANDYEIVQHGNDVYLKLASDRELIAIFENTSTLNLSKSSFQFIQPRSPTKSVMQQRHSTE